MNVSLCTRVFALTLLVTLLIAGCANAQPTAVSVPATTTPVVLEGTASPQPPTATATRTSTPPTATDIPPTDTPVPPTAMPTPIAAHAPELPSVDEVLAELNGLPIDEFLKESYRQLQLREPDLLFANGFADAYDATIGTRFTDMSIDHIRDTEQLEREILGLLQTYGRSTLSAEQAISYDALVWYLDLQVRGQAFAATSSWSIRSGVCRTGR